MVPPKSSRTRTRTQDCWFHHNQLTRVLPIHRSFEGRGETNLSMCGGHKRCFPVRFHHMNTTTHSLHLHARNIGGRGAGSCFRFGFPHYDSSRTPPVGWFPISCHRFSFTKFQWKIAQVSVGREPLEEQRKAMLKSRNFKSRTLSLGVK